LASLPATARAAQHGGMPTTGPASALLTRRRAELAAELEELDRRARQLRADIVHLDVAAAIVDPARCSAGVPRLRAQRRPEWFGDLGRLCLGVLRGAAGPLTSRQVAVAVRGLAGHDAGDEVAVRVVGHRVHASLTRRVGSGSWSGCRSGRAGRAGGWLLTGTGGGVPIALGFPRPWPLRKRAWRIIKRGRTN
jgi:hypothetical protein